MNSVFNFYTTNPLHDGKREVTGVKNVALGKKTELAPVKEACKKLGVTVNDMMTCALSIALKRYFISVGDEQTSSCKIAMPVNIRWKPYNTFESVKLENKFAPIAVEIPLLSDPERALPAVYSVTSNMKSKFAEIYATYVGILMMGNIAPASLIAKLNDMVSMSPTLAFSNMPGILTPIHFGD